MCVYVLLLLLVLFIGHRFKYMQQMRHLCDPNNNKAGYWLYMQAQSLSNVPVSYDLIWYKNS